MALITSLKGQTLTVKLQVAFNKSVKMWKGLKGNFSGWKVQMSQCALFSATLFQDIKNTADHKRWQRLSPKNLGGRFCFLNPPSHPPTHKHTKGNMPSCKLRPVKCLLGLKGLLWTRSLIVSPLWNVPLHQGWFVYILTEIRKTCPHDTPVNT